MYLSLKSLNKDKAKNDSWQGINRPPYNFVEEIKHPSLNKVFRSDDVIL